MDAVLDPSIHAWMLCMIHPSMHAWMLCAIHPSMDVIIMGFKGGSGLLQAGCYYRGLFVWDWFLRRISTI
jgi:hypothetical protein